MAARTGAAVAASSQEKDEDGVRQPAGDVHAWEPGTNQTLCGLALSRSRLTTFPHVPFSRVAGASRERPVHLCPRCSAATGRNRREKHSWTRDLPRP